MAIKGIGLRGNDTGHMITSKTEHQNTSLQDQDAQAVSFSYVSGGMTIGGSMHAVDNVGGAAATDNEGYELNITFAF